MAVSHRASRLLGVSPANGPEAALRGSVVVMIVVTGAVWLGGDINSHWVLPTADVALDTVALSVSGTLALLSWIRFRGRDEPIALYHASAFLALALAYGAALAISLEGGERPFAIAEPAATQDWVYAIARFLAALLLVAAGLARWPEVTRRGSVAILLIPALLVLATALAVPQLPGGWSAILLTQADSLALPAITPFGMVLQVTTAALFFLAAHLCRAAWQREHAVMDAWVAVGLVIAGFAEILWALYPSGHPGQVSIADLLRLAFYVPLLIGLQAEGSVTLRRMRDANAELTRLREADLERAALEERARLARELHDGLAQDLWLAKLRVGELSSRHDLPPAARRALEDTESAIDNGLAEARGAVSALRNASGQTKGFRVVLRETAEDFEDRYGVRAEFSWEGDTIVIATRTQAEMLRVVQEALTNVRRHADATVVRIRLVVDDGWLELSIADNGRGFDVTRGGDDWYGLASMHERAALVGGSLDIQSTPGDGTRVRLRVPATQAPTPAALAAAAP